MRRSLGRLQPEHLLTAAVAVGLLGLAIADGGHSPVAYSTFSLVVWGLALIGLAAGILPRSGPPRQAALAGALLGGLVVMIALSLAWAGDAQTAFEDAVRAAGYLGLFVLVVLLSRRGGAPAWLRGLAIGLVAIAVLALGSRLLGVLFGDPDAELASRLPAAAGRLSFPIGYWNGLAAAMAAAVVLLGWFGANARGVWTRAACTGLVPLVVLTLYLAVSRGGFIALGLGLVVLVIAARERAVIVGSAALGLAGGGILIALASSREAFADLPGTPAAETQGLEMLGFTALAVVAVALARRGLDRRLAAVHVSRRVAVAASIGALVAGTAVLFALAGGPADLWEEFKQPPGEIELARGSSGGRYQFWSVALEAAAENPAGGLGSGDYGAYWNRERPVDLDTRDAHSLFLESAAELGVLGALLSVGFFAVVGWAGIARLRGGGPQELAPALALLAVGALVAAIEWVWNLPAVFAVTVIAAALLSGPATLGPDAAVAAPRGGSEARTRRRFAAGVALVLFAWLAICASALLLLSERAIRDADGLLARGEYQASIERAAEALDLTPWAWEPYRVIATAYLGGGDPAAARTELDEAIERAPENAQLWLLATNFRLFAGDVDGARQSYARFRELVPRFTPTADEYIERQTAP